MILGVWEVPWTLQNCTFQVQPFSSYLNLRKWCDCWPGGPHQELEKTFLTLTTFDQSLTLLCQGSYMSISLIPLSLHVHWHLFGGGCCSFAERQCVLALLVSPDYSSITSILRIFFLTTSQVLIPKATCSLHFYICLPEHQLLCLLLKVLFFKSKF